ncbi:MAG: glycosyltransferase family 4 protein [Nitrosomonas sp.]|nr:glycosyltransferase family 4 protein [Nitrosomonas sp.]
MKILHASRESRADYRYGMGRANAMLLDGLKQIGMSADFMYGSDLDMDSIRRVTSWTEKLAKILPRTLCPVLYAIVAAWETGRMAGRRAIAQSYTHLHCHDAVVAAGARAELHGHPVVWGISQHGYSCVSRALHQYVHPLPYWCRAVLWCWERKVVSAASWIICPTASGRTNLALELKLSIDIRWHAIPHPRPVLNLPDKNDARHFLKWESGLRYILAVGQLIPLKRFEHIIDAMASLPNNCRLVILGDGDKSPYLSRAASLGLVPPVITSVDRISPYLAAADIFVSASLTESFGMAILEAMTADLPIICTRVGGVADVVGDAAELVNPNCSDLASRLEYLITNPAHCMDLAMKCGIRARKWPDRQAVARQYLQIYQNCYSTVIPSLNQR